MPIKALHARVFPDHPVSQRAVYKAVHSLVEAGVLIKAGGRILVDQEWMREVKSNLASTLPLLGAGERATYAFASIGHLDAFWKGMVLQLEELEGVQTFFYNPHNFWAYVPERKKSEDAYYAHFAQTKRHAFMVMGGINMADMDFKRTYQNDYFQIDARPVASLGRRDHITVMGDLVLTARVSKQLADKLDALYGSGQPVSQLQPSIVEAYRTPQRIRLMLEHNAQKAKKLRKLLSKNFVFDK